MDETFARIAGRWMYHTLAVQNWAMREYAGRRGWMMEEVALASKELHKVVHFRHC